MGKANLSPFDQQFNISKNHRSVLKDIGLLKRRHSFRENKRPMQQIKEWMYISKKKFYLPVSFQSKDSETFYWLDRR